MSAFEALELSETEQAEIQKYKSFGKDWMERSARCTKAHKWVKQNLTMVSENYGKPYNCCQTGVIVYKRTDGKPITQDDIDAIKALDSGQKNDAIGNAGDMTVTHDWLCDSGD
jgi:hypothetical protein